MAHQPDKDQKEHKRNARRALFPEQNSCSDQTQDFGLIHQQIVQEKSDQWNYDFKKDNPIENKNHHIQWNGDSDVLKENFNPT